MKKRCLSAILVIMLVFTASGCGGSEDISSDEFFTNKKYFYVDSSASTGSQDDSASSAENPASHDTQDGTQSSDSAFISTLLDDSQLAGNISNSTSGGMQTLATEKYQVYGYNADWSFNHGAIINYFNGRFYAFWQHGRVNEDSCGQHIVYATSEDGATWSEAQDFIPIKTDRYGNEMLSSPYGSYVSGNRLIVYVYEFGYDPNELAASADHTRPANTDTAKKLSKSFYAMYTTDGVNWTVGENLPLNSGGNRDPRVLPCGRLFWAGFDGLAYSDDLSGLTGWMKVGPTVAQVRAAYKRGNLNLLTEGAVYESDDGIIHFLMRSNTQYLWATSSHDRGRTWGDIYQTNFTDDCQKFDFMHLPDGRIMYIGTPGYTGYNFRLPLVAAVSENGYTFDKQFIIRNEPYVPQKSASSKLGNYSYPSAMIHGDYVYVIYAKQKEVIELSKFKWTDLK